MNISMTTDLTTAATTVEYRRTRSNSNVGRRTRHDGGRTTAAATVVLASNTIVGPEAGVDAVARLITIRHGISNVHSEGRSVGVQRHTQDSDQPPVRDVP